MKTIKAILAGLCFMAAVSCNQQEEKNQNGEAMKNDVIENIMSRRSIRKYKAIPVGRDTLQTIMECGIYAPNGQNKQSWEIRVVDNRELLDEMSQAMSRAHDDSEFAKECFRGAPVMVFIAQDLSYDFSSYDCGLLAENIMLSANSLGVGSICLGSPVRFLTDNEICKPYVEKLDFPETYELCLCVGLGYAEEQPEPTPRDSGKIKFVD